MQKKGTRHDPGTTPAKGRPRRAPDTRPIAPVTVARLLTIHQAAAYLGVSFWTVRGLIANEKLRRVSFAGRTDGKGIRRILIDRQDLDALIERAKK